MIGWGEIAFISFVVVALLTPDDLLYGAMIRSHSADERVRIWVRALWWILAGLGVMLILDAVVRRWIV